MASRPAQRPTKQEADQVETIARCIYESIFIGQWSDTRGIERACYLQAAYNVLERLGIPCDPPAEV